MSVSAVAAKNAPVVLPLVGGALTTGELPAQVAAVAVGLFFGAMWRAGSLHSEGKTWKAVRTDLVVSILIGGANAVLALALVDILGVGPLLAMAIGTVIGATGLRAMPEAKAALVGWATRRILGDNVALVQPPDPAIEEKIEALKKEDTP